MRKLLSFNMSKEEEDLFRQHYLRAETRQAVISMLILMAPLLAFIYNDYSFIGPGLMFACVVGARILLFAATLGIVLFLWHNRNYHIQDRVITIWCLVGMTVLVMVSFSRPGNYIGHAVIDIVIIMIVYLALPNKVINRAWLCLAFTVAETIILFVYKTQYENSVFFTIVFSFLVANVAGFVVSWQLSSMRRREFRSQIEEAGIREELIRLADIDDLTGIYNSRAFHRLAMDELARVRRYRRPLVFIMLDLDHFKLVNDEFGHMMGDTVLREVAKTVSLQLREVDIMGRMGGEEFGILLPETLLDDGKIVAGRISDALRRMNMTTDSGIRLVITVSMGLTEARYEEDINMDSIIARADKALYRAKENGRDCVELN